MNNKVEKDGRSQEVKMDAYSELKQDLVMALKNPVQLGCITGKISRNSLDERSLFTTVNIARSNMQCNLSLFDNMATTRSKWHK